jgi:hypothetical protein
MFRKVFEGICAHDFPDDNKTFKSEDGGKALIATIYDEVPPPPADAQAGMFVRVQSWDETGQHVEARQIEGKRIRITIEELP